MITTRSLEKSFGRRQVLNGLDLTVHPGAVTLLVGSNGAGKTTTLRLVAGLSEPDAGGIEIVGHDLRRARQEALARLVYLPQAPRFHPRLTVRDTMEFYARLRGRSIERAIAAINDWGLDSHAREPSGKLSGGLRQRLALAIFALADAPVLLLDEPGLSLDPEWRARLQGYLREQAALGRTVLVATHLLGEWEGRADRCLLVEHGRAGGEIPPDALQRHFPSPPASPASAKASEKPQACLR